jgi:hypothetical protein
MFLYATQREEKLREREMRYPLKLYWLEGDTWSHLQQGQQGRQQQQQQQQGQQQQQQQQQQQ